MDLKYTTSKHLSEVWSVINCSFCDEMAKYPQLQTLLLNWAECGGTDIDDFLIETWAWHHACSNDNYNEEEEYCNWNL